MNKNWEYILSEAKVSRVGGLFNGARPVHFVQEQAQFDTLKPQINDFIKRMVITTLINDFAKFPCGNEYEEHDLKEFVKKLRKEWLT